MNPQAYGYAGLGWATFLAAQLTDSVFVVGAVLGALVAVSTL